uniref:Olfactory receptor n=2 Tax=Anolis carolinensis TaxID=28377 RepID=H9GQC4_ANOCA
MEMKNHSAITEFILVGLSSAPEHQMILFWLFSFIYAVAVISNILTILAINTCSKLHTPMYFLLVNLSVINICSVSVIVPKMLQTILAERKSITFTGCIAQVYLFNLMLGTELMLLALMAFDRYAAICHPFQYMVIMRKEFCLGAVTGLWLIGMANSAIQTGLVAQLSFCDSNVINHFFCELPPMFNISCSDTSLNESMVFVASVTIVIGSCAVTLTSYCFIVRDIIKIRSTESKRKAFSTCSSHLLVVSFYYSTIIYTFLRPASAYSLEEDKVIAIIYSVLIPVLNPLIYSLRNTDVKEALIKLVVKRVSQKY